MYYWEDGVESGKVHLNTEVLLSVSGEKRKSSVGTHQKVRGRQRFRWNALLKPLR